MSLDPVTDVCIYGGVMFVMAMAILFCPNIAKGRGGTAHPEGSKERHGWLHQTLAYTPTLCTKAELW